MANVRMEISTLPILAISFFLGLFTKFRRFLPYKGFNSSTKTFAMHADEREEAEKRSNYCLLTYIHSGNVYLTEMEGRKV